MFRKRKIGKYKIIISILFTLLLIAFGVIWYWSLNIFVIENVSGKTAQIVTVTVCRKNYSLDNLPHGESRRILYKVTEDSGFHVDVAFEEGSQVSGNFGYVTGGAGAYNNKAEIKILSNGIEGKQG